MNATTEIEIGASTAGSLPVDSRRIAILGRTRELALMREARDIAVAGNARTLLLSGEPGIGKTTLLRSFLREAAHQAALVLTADCFELEATQPFAPFAALLEQIRARGDEVHEITEVRKLLSDVHRESAVDRRRVCIAWARALALLARTEPVIVAVDDLQWADDASLELFEYLIRKLRDAPVLFLGTFRPQQLTSPRLETLRSAALRDADAAEIALAPLTRADTLRLVGDFLQVERLKDRELAARLHERTSGNPLLIVEILHTLVRNNRLQLKDGAWFRSDALSDELVPSSIASTVRGRLDAMTGASAAILRAAAVLGPRFSHDALESVTAFGRDELIAALRVGIESQLLEEDRTIERFDYRFRHVLLRDALESTLLGPERAALHATTAAVLEGRAGHAELAHHYAVAGDRVSAARHHLGAAVDAVNASAFDAMLEHSERALELAPDDMLPVEGFLHLVPAWYQHAEPARALRFADELLRRSEHPADRLSHGRVMTFRGLVLERLGRMDVARLCCGEAVAELEPLGDSRHFARALANLAGYTTVPAQAIALADRAVAVARRVDAGDGSLIHAAAARGGVLIRFGLFDEGIAQIAEAADIVREQAKALGPHLARINSLGIVANNLRGARGSRALRDALRDEVISLARAGDLRSRFVIQAEDRAALERGDWDASLQLQDELRGFVGATPEAVAGELRVALMRLLRIGPDASLALDGLETRMAEAAPSPATAQQAAAWSAAIALALGQHERALALASLARAAAMSLGPSSPVAALAVGTQVYGITAARLAAGDEAFIAWTRAATTGGEARSLAAQAAGAFARAERSIREGDLNAGVDALRQAADDLVDLEQPLVEQFVRLRRVEVLALAGRSSDAQRELDPLVAYWRTAKADWHIARLRERLAPLGLEIATPRARGKAPAGSITRREREVATLVADGLTNKDIAARLGISARTAESHVEQIRAKLGFTSRAQIAAWVASRSRV